MAVPGVKVQDGLFVGNEASSQDEEAIRDNKVTRIINCCGKQVSNVFDASLGWVHEDGRGIEYKTYNWVDSPTQVILDPQDKVINEVYNFVEEALEQGDGVLIHSFFGSSRSICLVSAFMMMKYRWSLKKTTQFLKSRQLELQMKPNFEQQLSSFEFRLAARSEGGLSMDWEPGGLESGELLLRNTYLNVSALTPIDLRPTPPRTHKLKWTDDMADDKSRLERPPSPSRGTAAAAMRHSALKGGRAARAAAGGGGAGAEGAVLAAGSGGGAITIRTRAGVVKCHPEEIVHKRFGLKFECSTIILEYSVPTRNLRAHHAVKVDLPSLATGTAACDAAAAEHLKQAHAPWLNGVSAQQLAELVGRLRTASVGGGANR